MAGVKHEYVIQKGARVKLACKDEDCWVGDVEVTSKGGRAWATEPGCPHCRNRLDPVSADGFDPKPSRP